MKATMMIDDRGGWALELEPDNGTERAMLEVMASCPITARQMERYSWKPQTQAMREGDRWQTIDEFDDLATCLRYFVQTNPRYQGRQAPRPRPLPMCGVQANILRRWTRIGQARGVEHSP